jgi:hypothetical protein
MTRKHFLSLFAGAATLAAQQRQADLNDGEAHGDPPFLIEPGWLPLLNGRDTSGWVGEDGKPHEWFTTTGIRWDRLLGPTRLSAVKEPGDRIVNGPGRTANLVTQQKFGDMELYLQFMLAKGSNSGVYLHGLYEVQVFDSFGSTEPIKSSDGGGIYHRWINNQGVGGSAPRVNASRMPGQWQSYYILFRGPRFDGAGKKTENAKFVRVVYNGTLVQENVEVDGPTRAAMNIPEAAANPIMLQGDHGPVAYKDIYWRPLRALVDR